MFDSKTFTTKTFWAGVVAIVAGVGLIVQGEAAEGIQSIAAGIIAITVRDAITKV